MGLHLVVGQRSCEPNKHIFLQNVQLSFVCIAMTNNQLYVANFPFSFGEKEICACVVERFPTPERIVPLHRGKAGPMRRLSCFIHWHPGNCPAPEEISGWIPNMLAALGWTVPRMASWPFAPWLKRHHGATNRQGGWSPVSHRFLQGERAVGNLPQLGKKSPAWWASHSFEMFLL